MSANVPQGGKRPKGVNGPKSVNRPNRSTRQKAEGPFRGAASNRAWPLHRDRYQGVQPPWQRHSLALVA